MRSKLAIVLLLASLPLTASATQKEDCASGSTSSCLNNVLDSISALLSSTNPKNNALVAESPASKVAKIETAAGNVGEAKPLHSNDAEPQPNNSKVDIKKAELKPILKKANPIPRAMIVPEITENLDQLAPETKRTLRKLPSGLGNLGDGKKEELVIDHSEDSAPTKAKNGLEPVGVQKTKPKFEISVEDGKTTEDVVTTLDKALKAMNMGQYEGAIYLYKKALDKDPKNRDGLFGLGTAYHKSGQKVQARKYYGKLLALYPDYKEGLNNLLALASMEAPEDALKELALLEKRNPNFAPIYAQKAVIYTKTGHVQEAMQNLRKALSLEPDDNNYRYNLAVLLDKQGDYENARIIYHDLLDSSYKGGQLPVNRKIIEDRLTFISSQKVADSSAH